jgi:hypothetical protein
MGARLTAGGGIFADNKTMEATFRCSRSSEVFPGSWGETSRLLSSFRFGRVLHSLLEQWKARSEAVGLKSGPQDEDWRGKSRPMTYLTLQRD